jgi:heme-based aerotactic transducer
MELSARWRRMTDYIGLTDADTALLNSKTEEFDKIADSVTEDLYRRVAERPELMAIIGRHSTIGQLKKTQRAYFMSMCAKELDDAYFERRMEIGRVHSRIGLTTDWYLGTYMVYLDVAIAHLRRVCPDDWTEVTLALSKMFNLDSQIVLEVYHEQEKAKIEQLADERGSMLRVITSSVQELSAMMTDLGRSSRTVADNAREAMHAQERSGASIRELEHEIHEIAEIGTVMRELSDRTHLLGLNAAIEAAHAGEYGRGFSVVAGEVRKLAASSKESLEAVHDKLDRIRQSIRTAVEISERSAEYASRQSQIAEELSAYVQMIERVAAELESLKESAAAGAAQG